MVRVSIFAAAALVLVAQSAAVSADDFKLPAGITPAVKAACEADVRRLCVDGEPSYAKVKACVIAKFGQFGTRCKMQVAMAGLKP
jgi:hypothetical protein